MDETLSTQPSTREIVESMDQDSQAAARAKAADLIQSLADGDQHKELLNSKLLDGHDTPFAYPPGELEFESGKGAYLFDREGNDYFDANAGTFNISLGYGNREVTEAVSQVLDSGLVHSSGSHRNAHVEAACCELLSIAPDNIECVHMKGSTGGSTAIEQAIRAVTLETGRHGFVSFRNGHHGQTIASTETSGMPFRKQRLPASALDVISVKPPDCFRCPWNRQPETCGLECVEHIEQEIDEASRGPETVGGAVFEPVLGAGGGITPPGKYWPEVFERLRDRRGIRIIFDEAQTWGRTGTNAEQFFFAQYYGVEPDLITLAKGIAGVGLAGASAVLMPRRFALLNEGERSLTGGANPLVSAAIAKTIQVMKDDDFWHSQRAAAHELDEALERLRSEFRCIGIVRGIGLMRGLEIVKPGTLTRDMNLTLRILKHGERNRLLLRNSEYGRGSFIKIRPRLNITTDEVEDLVSRLRMSIQSALSAE